ncbi:MAG: hypothetical protein AVDCRST_MAG19-1035, partial [uncultured Thermomicrobiales bacterium]
GDGDGRSGGAGGRLAGGRGDHVLRHGVVPGQPAVAGVARPPGDPLPGRRPRRERGRHGLGRGPERRLPPDSDHRPRPRRPGLDRADRRGAGGGTAGAGAGL